MTHLLNLSDQSILVTIFLMTVSRRDFLDGTSIVVVDKTVVSEDVDDSGSSSKSTWFFDGNVVAGESIDGSGSSTMLISFWLSTWSSDSYW